MQLRNSRDVQITGSTFTENRMGSFDECNSATRQSRHLNYRFHLFSKFIIGSFGSVIHSEDSRPSVFWLSGKGISGPSDHMSGNVHHGHGCMRLDW